MNQVLNSIKKGLKQPLINRQHTLYQKEILDKAQTYDCWIRKKEQKILRDRIEGKYHTNFQTNATEKLLNDCKNKLNDGELAKNELFGIYAVQNCQNLSMKSFFVCSRDFFEKKFPRLEDAGCKLLEKINVDMILFYEYPGALSELCLPLFTEYFEEHSKAIIAYGDVDSILENQQRTNPDLKPDWSPDTFLDSFYCRDILAIRSKDVIAGIKERQTIDLFSVCYDVAGKSGGFEKRAEKQIFTDFAVGHISEILFHRTLSEKQTEGSQTADNRAETVYSGAKKTEILKEICSTQEAEQDRQEIISVIIPSKDNPEVLATCISSFLDKTEVPKQLQYELIVVDNGSNAEHKQWIEAYTEKLNQEEKHGFLGCRYFYQKMTFNFSHMCNLGVSVAQGNYFLFLNDDMEIIQADWLTLLWQKAGLSYAGAVGAKLLYPDSNRIQHAGITNLRIGPAHKLQFLPDDQCYYYGRNRGVHDMAAVTGACLLVRKEVYEEAGGFLEELAVAFNDVDLCYRILEAGYYNIQRNDVVLYHHESLSRGKDGESPEKQQRLMKEKDLLYRYHQDIYGRDPFYHKYLTTDMVESMYTPACRNEVTLDMPWSKMKKASDKLQMIPQDACVVVGMENAVDLYKWRYGVTPEYGRVKLQPGEEEYYFQGYSFIIGADNACYQKTLLLQNTNTEETWEISVENRYREDIKENLKDQLNVDLTGFAAKVRRGECPVGNYRFGMLFEDHTSRQKLLNWSNWEFMVKDQGKTEAISHATEES